MTLPGCQSGLTLAAGEAIYFENGGIWQSPEQWQLASYGTVGSPITFGRYSVSSPNVAVLGAASTGAKPIIMGATATSNVVDGTHWVDQGSGVYAYTIASPGWFYEDGHALSKASSTAKVGVDGSWAYGSGAIYYKPKGTGALPSDHTLTRETSSASLYMVSLSLVQYLTFDGLDFRQGTAISCSAVNGPIIGLIFQNCAFSNCSTGIQILPRNGYSASDCIIQDCTFDCCLINIFLEYYPGSLCQQHINQKVLRNTITKSNQTYWLESWNSIQSDRDGISLQNQQGVLIEHNEISGLCDAGAGIAHWMSAGASAWQASHAYVVGNEVSPITPTGFYYHCTTSGNSGNTEPAWNTTLWGTTNDNAGGGTAVWRTIPAFNPTGNIYRYNYIHDLGGSGIGNGGNDVSSSNVQIIGNIIANCGTAASGTPGPPWGGLRLNRAQTSATPSGVYNNVIYNCDYNIYLFAVTDYYNLKNNVSLSPVTYHVASPNGKQHFVMDHNLYYPLTANGSKPFRFSATDDSLPDWKTAMSPQDADALSSDPLFANVVGGAVGFKLLAGSPAIGAGVAISGQIFDRGGIPWGASTNMGAWATPSFAVHGAP